LNSLNLQFRLKGKERPISLTDCLVVVECVARNSPCLLEACLPAYHFTKLRSSSGPEANEQAQKEEVSSPFSFVVVVVVVVLLSLSPWSSSSKGHEAFVRGREEEEGIIVIGALSPSSPFVSSLFPSDLPTSKGGWWQRFRK
jgi:hypothetical protein